MREQSDTRSAHRLLPATNKLKDTYQYPSNLISTLTRGIDYLIELALVGHADYTNLILLTVSVVL